MDPEIEKLLILQDRDSKRWQTEHQLALLPRERQNLEAKIAGEKGDLQSARDAFKALELRRRELEKEIQEAEEKIIKYKTQQMQVKKNEEYQALNHEIETLQAKVSALEEEEIRILLEIDEGRVKLDATEKNAEERISLLQKEVSSINTREQTLNIELVSLRAEVTQLENTVHPEFLVAYQRARGRKINPPWVVPLENQKCQGCHLKVSGEVASAVRKHNGPVHCDSCGRVVYWP